MQFLLNEPDPLVFNGSKETISKTITAQLPHEFCNHSHSLKFVCLFSLFVLSQPLLATLTEQKCFLQYWTLKNLFDYVIRKSYSREQLFVTN